MTSRRKVTLRTCLSVFFVAVLVMVLSQSGHAQTAAKPIKLTYALFQPATAAITKVNTEFAKEIEKRTNGRVQITVFPGGSLIGAPQMFQGVKNGIADMGNAITSYTPGNFPFTSIAELPNGAESGWAISYAQYDFINKYQPKEWDGVHLLTAVSPGADNLGVGSGKKPIQKMEDWKGKSVRTNHADITVALGGTVKDVPMADVYDSLSKGVLDVVVGTTEPFKSWKLGDVCKYITINTSPLQPSIVWYNIMNKGKWNSLPADIQKIIAEVSNEYVGKLGVAWDDQGVAGIEYCKSVGANIYVLPKAEADRWGATTGAVIDARLKALVKKGFSQKEVDEAWAYFKGRVAYWNGQQAKQNITPLIARLEKAAGK
jgi:TRAP-type C4-dicarboxylate transport system substrate-binding protein